MRRFDEVLKFALSVDTVECFMGNETVVVVVVAELVGGRGPVQPAWPHFGRTKQA